MCICVTLVLQIQLTMSPSSLQKNSAFCVLGEGGGGASAFYPYTCLMLNRLVLDLRLMLMRLYSLCSKGYFANDGLSLKCIVLSEKLLGMLILGYLWRVRVECN